VGDFLDCVGGFGLEVLFGFVGFDFVLDGECVDFCGGEE